MFEIHQSILGLATLYHRKHLTQNFGSTFTIFRIIRTVTVFPSVLHQRTTGIKQALTQIRECPDFVGTESIIALRTVTGSSIIPVDRKQVSSTLEVFCHLLGIFLIAFARHIERLDRRKRSFQIRQTAPVSCQLKVEPGTKEIKLAFKKITFFLCSILQQTILQSLKAQIGLTDSIPASPPKGLGKTITVQ